MNDEGLLHGKTLRIYLYMLRRNRPVGIREIMRSLRFSSPSLVHYHINKLLNAGYVDQVGSKYVVKKPIKLGLMKYFIIISGRFLPKYVLYAGIFTTFLIFQIVALGLFPPIVSQLFSVFVVFLATLIMWIESINFWKEISRYLQAREEDR